MIGVRDKRDHSPKAILHAFDLIRNGITYKGKVYRLPHAVLSGSLGNEEHYANGGYHVPRHAVAKHDYSVQHKADLTGDKYAASALDVTLPHKNGDADNNHTTTMMLITHRVYVAFHNRDPRAIGIVEIGGTLDQKVTFAYYRYSQSYELGTWDPSHLEHIHISGERKNVDNAQVWNNIAAIIVGVPMTKTQALRAAATRKAKRVKKIK